MTLTVNWYARKPDGTTDYDKLFVEHIEGETAADCMSIYRMEGMEHDISLYSPRQIVNVED